MLNSISLKVFDEKIMLESGYENDQMLLLIFKDDSTAIYTIDDYMGDTELPTPIMYAPIYLMFNETVDGYQGVVNHGDYYSAVVVLDGRQIKLGDFATSREAAFVYDVYIMNREIDYKLNFDHGDMQ